MKIVITGASSGIGKEVAKLFISEGYNVTICGRRIELLQELQELAPTKIKAVKLDVNNSNCTSTLQQILEEGGKTDIYFHASGIGCHNEDLDWEKELSVIETNAVGFARCVTTAFKYFKQIGGGHIAVISSIAGTKGLGAAPSYSASKAFDNTYIQCLAQLSTMTSANIKFTDIKPGFVATALLDSNRKYPLIMKPEYAAKKIFKAIKKQKRKKIIDWKYSIITFFWKLIPDFIWERLKIDAH